MSTTARKLKIAQIAPLWERVPPPAYGGTELVVSYLTDALAARGHDVTLFASGDSVTEARLSSLLPQSLRAQPLPGDYRIFEQMHLGMAYGRSAEFDIIHSHISFASHTLASLVATPTVHTLHKLAPDARQLYAQYRHHNYISISHSQQKIAPELNFIGNAYNGIDPKLHPFCEVPDNPPYLAFLGRMSPEKGPHLAVQIARESGMKLKMAGKVDAPIQEFFDREVAPYIDGSQIEFLGELGLPDKCELLGKAAITLHPITYDEPFGLVLIESMCVGTPVLAIGLGAIPEIIVAGKNGFFCRDAAEIVAKIPVTLELDRAECRRYVEDNFSVEKMVNTYEKIYFNVVDTVAG